jgi:hypothetical protein
MSDWDNLVEPTRGALENKLYDIAQDELKGQNT